MLRTQTQDVKTRRAALTVLQGFAPLEEGPQPRIDTGERLTLTADTDLGRAILLPLRRNGAVAAMALIMDARLEDRTPSRDRRIVSLDMHRHLNEARR